MSLSRRDYQLLAAGWDAAVSAMRYEDGTPVEIAESINPYTQHIQEESLNKDYCTESESSATWGACGVQGCDECFPLFDADNNVITGTDV